MKKIIKKLFVKLRRSYYYMRFLEQEKIKAMSKSINGWG